jgi:hypothetical protein
MWCKSGWDGIESREWFGLEKWEWSAILYHGGWKKVSLQINKQRNTIQDALKHQAIKGK